MSKQDKYYDDVKFYPASTYHKDNGETTRIKTIRLTQDELENWDSKAIHDFLQGNIGSRDADLINKLKLFQSGYQQYNSLFEIMMKNASKMLKKSQFDSFKQMIKDNINLELIKKINAEMS